MEEIVIKAVRRDVIGKQVRALRRAGKLPAVLYGIGVNPTPITLDLREASRTLSHIASSSLVTVDIEGERHLALVREKQRNFILGTLTHVDFQVVSLEQKLRVEVPLEITGESPAVKDFNGILVTNVEEVEVECLPGDLPSRILVDISRLKAIGDSLLVRDLELPANVQVLDNPEEVIVVVTAPAVEEVEEVAEVVEAAPEPEVIERGKKEEEEEF